MPSVGGENANPEQQVMEMLAGFEERLAELRRLWDEHRRAEAKLKEKETEFARREAEHKAQLEQFTQRLEQAERERAELERRQAELKAIDEQTSLRAAETDEAARRADALQAQAAEAERAASERARARQDQLDSQEQAIQSLSRELEDQRAALAERETKLRAAAEQVAGLEQEAGRSRDEAVRAADIAREELKTALSERDLLAAELERREKTQAEAGERSADELEALRQTLAAQSAELEQIRARLAESDAARAGQGAEAGERTQAFERTLKERDEALAAARADLARLADELKAQRERGGAGGEALATARRTLEEREAALARSAEEAAALKARVGELEHEITALRESEGGVKSLVNEETAALRAELERTKAELSLAVDTCDRAHAELKKAQARATRQAGGPGLAPAFARDAARLELRRQRLARVKGLHRQQSNKIRVASEALRKRLEQCEQLLTLRAELAQARQALEQAHKRVQRQRGVGRVATTLLCFSVMVALLGAMSWVVAGQIWPGKFVASATVQAQARGRELLPEERADWQAFHLQLVEDPRFVERAAESLGKRGITTLSQPGDLGAYLKANMTVRSPGDGEISMEMKGDGAERTARILDTVVTTLAAEANAARAKRIDGGSTDIKLAATAGESPIDDTRLRQAGMLWGSSVGAFLVLGLFVWGRLAAAKLRYEGQMHVEHVLEEERWPAIPGLGPSKGAGSPIPSTPGRA